MIHSKGCHLMSLSMSVLIVIALSIVGYVLRHVALCAWWAVIAASLHRFLNNTV